MNRRALDFHSEALLLLLARKKHRYKVTHEGPMRETGKSTHINGFVIEVLDVLRAHIQGGLARHQEH